MAKKNFGEYYLGLDMGTNSVGWAVTDTKYEVLRFNGKAMWGIHLFKEGKTAEDRRSHRIARRRLERRNQRIRLLRQLMDMEISKVDRTFFDRLDESGLIRAEKREKQGQSLFNDSAYKDKDYHKKYPTIYHLRSDLIKTDSKPDIRLVYLALAHIMKHRGHFLYEGLGEGIIPEFETIFGELLNRSEEMGLIDATVTETVPQIKSLLQQNGGISTKKEGLKPLLEPLSESDETKTYVNQLIIALAGGSFSVGKMFGVEENLEDSDFKKSVSLNDSKIDDGHDGLVDLIGPDYTEILDRLRSIFNWSVLSRILKDDSCISHAKIRQYEQHRQDLSILKYVLKNLGDGGKLYDAVFSSSEPDSYAMYSGNTRAIKEKVTEKWATQEDFCNNLKKKLEKYWGGILSSDCAKGYESKIEDMKARIEASTFMPLQKNKDNSLLPNAVHREECKAILENVSRFYPSLAEKDANGLSVSEKILLLCKFRMPYYIGPVGKKSKNGWAVRKSEGEIRPWNFSELIDVEETSKKFIEKLIGTCTYLLGERVIPKQSVAYRRYMLYDELNKISVNGERISPEMKTGLVQEYFENKNTRVTVKTIQEFYRRHKGTECKIDGIDGFVKNNLESENKLRSVLKNQYSNDLAEEIIREITIFGDDRARLKTRLKSAYGDKLSEEIISNLSNLRYRDWGRFSNKFLRGITAEVEGRNMSILTALKETNRNLMELLSKEFGFTQEIEKYNADMGCENDEESILERMRCSPAVRHAVRRCQAIIGDIVKITGHPPTKVFIETTREHQESKRTESRKSELIARYMEICKNSDSQELLSQLETTDEARLRGKKLFLYYTQHGRCMYCERRIDLNELGNKDHCDVDHIYPQSKIKDDSIRNNLVLTCRTCNSVKEDKYPLKSETRKDRGEFWKTLKDEKLISDEKYARLTRQTEFNDADLSGFINRQIVETSQSVKALASILKYDFGDDSDIVYVKGGNVSEFRNDMVKENRPVGRGNEDSPDGDAYPFYIKCRNINDHHHAKDAYLNIVVGNVYDVKFTKNPINFLKTGEKYNLDKMYRSDVQRNGVVAWKAGPDGTIATVDKWMRRDNILYTRAPYEEGGQLFKLTILKAGNGQHPIKNDRSIENYGGYDSVSSAFFALFEHDGKKGKKERTLVAIPQIALTHGQSKEILEAYASNSELKLKNPELRFAKLKVDSCIEINGFKLNIRGISSRGASILYIPGEQMMCPFKYLRTCKNTYNSVEQKNAKGNTVYSAKDMRLTEEELTQLYEFFLDKLSAKPFSIISPLSTARDNLMELKPSFMSLDLEGKTKIIAQIMKMFHCNPEQTSLSGMTYQNNKSGPGVAGRIILNSKISSWDSVFLVNQSPTGLFENKIDLLKI